MHACGHDMHVAWLAGAIDALAGDRARWRGTVLAVFQPAEEVVCEGAAHEDLEAGVAGLLADEVQDHGRLGDHAARHVARLEGAWVQVERAALGQDLARRRAARHQRGVVLADVGHTGELAGRRGAQALRQRGAIAAHG